MAATAKPLTSSTLALPPDTYIYTLARLQNSCAAISSDDTLTYFDPSNLSISSQVKNANKSITSLCATHDGAGVATAGRDGFVKVWDPRSEGVVREYRNRKRGFLIRCVLCFSSCWRGSSIYDGRFVLMVGSQGYRTQCASCE